MHHLFFQPCLPVLGFHLDSSCTPLVDSEIFQLYSLIKTGRLFIYKSTHIYDTHYIHTVDKSLGLESALLCTLQFATDNYYKSTVFKDELFIHYTRTQFLV